MNGLLLVDQKVEGNSSQIDFSAVRTGIYILKINTDKGTVTKKVSKL
ncbi:MAG: T9SS type A sorting domain-containing protein [Crocinitomicaceae bacterium]|nr:T9SS type A sorting domain-containing protein [Crocinitomicaceae bacterium]